jgi:hypothetical protein
MGILRDPSVGVLAEKLNACLQNARQAESSDYKVVVEPDRNLYLGQSRA